MSFYLERIQRGVDFIESHLDEPITLAQIARAGGLSQWHFQRIFKSLTGETLKTYVRSRRLARSLDRLLTTELRVLDIAILAGFESQEAYARAFRSAFGITPTEYRKIGKKSLFLKKLELDAGMLDHLAHNVSLEPVIYRQPRMLLVGMRTLFFGTDSEKNNLGEKLPALWSAFLERLPSIPNAVPGTCYGVVREERIDDDRLVYDAAIEVTALGALAKGMVHFEVPESTYARFEHRGPAKEVDRTVSYVYSTWLVQSGQRHTSGPDLEIYDSRYHPTRDTSVLEYAVPIEPP